MAIASVTGRCDERFAMVEQAMASNLESDADLGCSVAVVQDGELVVDLWGGHIDEACSMPWSRDTVTCVFSAEEIAGPLGVDFHIGTPASVDPRIAPAIPPEPAEELLDPESLVHRVATNPRLSQEDLASEAARRAEIPSGNGHGNARSVAMTQAAVSCGSGDLLSDAGREAIFEVQAEGTDW